MHPIYTFMGVWSQNTSQTNLPGKIWSDCLGRKPQKRKGFMVQSPVGKYGKIFNEILRLLRLPFTVPRPKFWCGRVTGQEHHQILRLGWCPTPKIHGKSWFLDVPGRKLGSKVIGSINGLFHLLINGIFVGVKFHPVILTHLWSIHFRHFRPWTPFNSHTQSVERWIWLWLECLSCFWSQNFFVPTCFVWQRKNLWRCSKVLQKFWQETKLVGGFNPSEKY